jgi:hypothetical protein
VIRAVLSRPAIRHMRLPKGGGGNALRLVMLFFVALLLLACAHTPELKTQTCGWAKGDTWHQQRGTLVRVTHTCECGLD